MGGCVSAPKEVALNEGEVAPVEISTTPMNAEGETVVVAQEEIEEVAEKKEEPLVDLSEAKEEIVESETKEEIVEAEAKEEIVEAKVEEVEVAAETKEPAKEEAKAEEAAAVEPAAEEPAAEEISQAPLVVL